MNVDPRLEITGTITRLLRRLPEREDDVFEKLFHHYFGQLQLVARKRLRKTNRRVKDEEDLVAEVLAEFLMQGGRNELPTIHSREDVLRMLNKRIRLRAINHLRDARAAKRGGGQLIGESGLQDGTNQNSGSGLAGFPTDEPTPPEVLILAEQVDQLHTRIRRMIGDPGLILYFERWAEGQSCREMEQTFQVSQATVYRKLNRLFDRLREYAGGPLDAEFHTARGD